MVVENQATENRTIWRNTTFIINHSNYQSITFFFSFSLILKCFWLSCYQGVALAKRRIRLEKEKEVKKKEKWIRKFDEMILLKLYLVLRSWSRIFFSISASVRVSMKGDHCSASACARKGNSTMDRGASLYQSWTRPHCVISVRNCNKYNTWKRRSFDATITGHEHCKR